MSVTGRPSTETMIATALGIVVFVGYVVANPHGSRLVFRTARATLFALLGFSVVFLLYTMLE